MYDLIAVGKNAHKAEHILRGCSASARNAALFSVAQALRAHKAEILEANRTDVEIARRGGCRTETAQRLTLTGSLIEAMAASVDAVIAMSDPIGVVEAGGVRPNGLSIQLTRVPVGIVAVVAEGCPSVAADAAALCIKSGNACIFSGGKNAFGTNRVLAQLIRQAIGEVGLPMDAFCPVEDVSQETTNRLLSLTGYVDLLIPRGEPAFVRKIVEQAKVPTLDTGCGCCHLYVDRDADLSMAVRIVDNAKTSAPEEVNSVETVLVHRDCAKEFLPKMQKALALHGVHLLGCPETCAILPDAAPARENDWDTDFRDYTLAVRIVGSLEEAVEHIEHHSAGVADGIVTQSLAAAQKFSSLVDTVAVCVNSSTRLVDGVSFGLGAQLGIAGQKLHVRGPVGLWALTAMKYIVTGDGQVR